MRLSRFGSLPCLLIALSVLLGIAPGYPAAAAAAAVRESLLAKGGVDICVLMWGSLTDGGFTEAHNVGLQEALDRLNTEFAALAPLRAPLRLNTHVGTEAEKEARIDEMLLESDCDVMFATFSDVIGSWGHWMAHVRARPQTLFVVEDARFAATVAAAALPNLLVTATNCDRAWYVAGYAVGLQVSGGCVGMVAAFADIYVDMQYAFFRGVRDSSPHTRAEIVPVGAWASNTLDLAAGGALLDVLNCTALAHITDEPAVNNLVVERTTSAAALHSIGWTFDRRPRFGPTVLISVLREFSDMFHDIAGAWIRGEGTLGASARFFPCRASALSSQASAATRAAVTAREVTLNMTADVWTRAEWRDVDGQLRHTGTLNESAVLSMAFIPSDLTQQPTLLDRRECPPGTRAFYATREGGGGGEGGGALTLTLVCAPCPTNTFRDAVMVASREFECAACPPDTRSSEGATSCDSGGGERALSGGALVGIIIAGVVVAVALLAAGGVALWRFAYRSGSNDMRSVTASIGAATSSGQMSLVPQDRSIAHLIAESGGGGNLSRSSAATSVVTGATVSAPPPRLGPATTFGSISFASGASDTSLTRAQRVVAMIEAGLFSVGQIIGKGATSVVYRVMLHDGSAVAMKEMHNTNDGDCEELQLLAELPPHPNIIRHLAVRHNAETRVTRLFMELMSGGSLRAAVREVQRPLADITARTFTTQIVSAVTFLHSHGIAHRDLNCGNILLDAEGRCRLADFGTARRITDSVTSMSFVGTPLWMAPEQLLGEDDASAAGLSSTLELAQRADTWSIGILVAEMLNRGEPPWPRFENAMAAIALIEGGGEPLIPAGSSGGARDFIRRCTRRSPAARPSSEQLLQHPWLALDPSGVSDSYGSSEPIDDDGEGGASVFVDASEQRQSYTLGPVIGVGAWGAVHRATLRDGTVVAAKALTFASNDAASEKRSRRLRREIQVMKQLDHPNVVRYLFTDTRRLDDVAAKAAFSKGGGGHSSNGGSSATSILLIFMELVEGGTLKQLVDKKHGMAEAEARNYVRAMLCGLAYLHSKNLVHRDVKPGNALLCAAPTFVKLADFGTTAFVGPNVSVSLTMQGTLAFMAPEVLRERAPTTAADIWSLGATVLELITGQTPWSHERRSNSLAVAAFVASKEPITLPKDLSPALSDFLLRCFDRDPLRRATAQELLEHSWMLGAADTGGAPA